MKIELDYIEKLAELLSQNGLTEISLEDGDRVIVLKKEKEIVAANAPASIASMPAAPAPVSFSATSSKSAEVTHVKKEESNLLKITSPMVGTFYKASSPTAAPFVEIGKSVSVGQVVCIIEAMKLMNEIESEVAGRIVEICVQDGEPVEYGQILMLVEP